MEFKEGDIVIWRSYSKYEIECQILYMGEDGRALITPLAWNQHADSHWLFLRASARQMPIEEYTQKVYPYKNQRGGFAETRHLVKSERIYTLKQLVKQLENEVK